MSGAIGMASLSATGPVSSPSAIFITHTPLSASPAMMARLIGAAPRQRGSSEACRLKQPSGTASRIGTGRISPYATTTAASALCARNSASASSVRNVFGVRTDKPKRRASRSTGVGCNSMPRPAGFGARV